MLKELSLGNVDLKRKDFVMHGGQYVTDAEESLNHIGVVKLQIEISSKQTFVHIISNSFKV